MGTQYYLIDPFYGGLGDHLFYSHLPRAIKEKWPESQIYLSRDVAFRSQEIYKMVWEKNPYLDGFAERSEFDWEPRKESVLSKGKHIMTILLENYGLDLEDIGIPEPLPEIYYTLRHDDVPMFGIVIDLNYSSFVGAILRSDIYKLVNKFKHKAIFINPDSDLKKVLPSSSIYQTKSLFEYAAILMNAGSIICLGSGGATLAQALGKRATVYYGCGFSALFMHSGNDNVQLGTNSIIRKLTSIYLREKNMRRRHAGDR